MDFSEFGGDELHSRQPTDAVSIREGGLLWRTTLIFAVWEFLWFISTTSFVVWFIFWLEDVGAVFAPLVALISATLVPVMRSWRYVLVYLPLCLYPAGIASIAFAYHFTGRDIFSPRAPSPLQNGIYGFHALVFWVGYVIRVWLTCRAEARGQNAIAE